MSGKVVCLETYRKKRAAKFKKLHSNSWIAVILLYIVLLIVVVFST